MGGPAVYERLAARLRALAVEAQAEAGTGAERFKVTQVEPLRMEQIGGGLVLEDGDPDFTVGSAMRDRMLAGLVVVGDEAWCLREGAEWHFVDVVPPA